MMTMKNCEIRYSFQMIDRDYNEHANLLLIPTSTTKSPENSILVIGGGQGVYDFPNHTDSKITNIDLRTYPELSVRSSVSDIRGDFILYDFGKNLFDLILGSYSLPAYCASTAATTMFLLKSIYYLKPGGQLRISPATPDPQVRNIITRNTTDKQVYKQFYKAMNNLASLGIRSEMFWDQDLIHWDVQSLNEYIDTATCFGLYPDTEISFKRHVKDATAKTIIDILMDNKDFRPLHFERYPNIQHKYSDVNFYGLAVIHKPVNNVENINNEIARQINMLRNRMKYPEIKLK